MEPEALRAYRAGLALVLGELTVDQVPEVGMNVAYAPPGARGAAGVVGLAGRVVRAGRTGRFAVAGQPEVGAPGHTGAIALALAHLAPGPWWVLNHRFHDEFVRRAADAKLELAEFSRAEEPPGQRTMEWGTRSAIERLGRVPDGVFDRGAWGKEPMIRLFAPDAARLAAKVRALRGQACGEP